MLLITAPAPRTGSALPAAAPAGARAVVRGAVRAVAATVGAVLAGLVLALPAVHLPLAVSSTGSQAAVVFSVDHRAPGSTIGLGPLAPTFAARSLVAPVGLVTPAVVQVVGAPAARAALPVAAPVTDQVLGMALVLLAAALVGVSRPLVRHRSSLRPPHQGPAPLRGPPAPLAPAP